MEAASAGEIDEQAIERALNEPQPPRVVTLQEPPESED